MIEYQLSDAPPAGLHEGDRCPDCRRPLLIDSTAALGHLPHDRRLFGALACPACRVFYLLPDDAADDAS